MGCGYSVPVPNQPVKNGNYQQHMMKSLIWEYNNMKNHNRTIIQRKVDVTKYIQHFSFYPVSIEELKKLLHDKGYRLWNELSNDYLSEKWFIYPIQN